MSGKTIIAEESFQPDAGPTNMAGPAERESDIGQLKTMLERLSQQVEELVRKIENMQSASNC